MRRLPGADGGGRQIRVVDGPEFDAHKVDWNSLLSRMAFYRPEELRAVERWRSSHECKLAGAVAKGVEYMAELTKKERMKIPRQGMPVQEADDRVQNFDEVALGFTLELARQEAERCLQCKEPKCMEGCPVEVAIPEFVEAVRSGDMAKAVRIMKDKNNLPAICGRVCPQEVQCESRCILGKKGEPVAIGRIERFVGDFELAKNTFEITRGPSTGKKVAVVGSGPASITCAVDCRLGHDVTIFESLHTPGGVLVDCGNCR